MSAWMTGRPGRFGSFGLLGVMWRTTAVDAFSVVSFDRGRSFSPPVKVNSATQPLDASGPPGDDWSWIAIDGAYAYITWSDGRTGFIDGIFGRVPVLTYVCAQLLHHLGLPPDLCQVW